MYANLEVIAASNAEVRPDAIATRTLARLPGRSKVEPMYAHEVVVRPDGSVSVTLDGNDGGSYAADAGKVHITGGVTIKASF